MSFIYQGMPWFSSSRILIFKGSQENIQISFSIMIVETELKYHWFGRRSYSFREDKDR